MSDQATKFSKQAVDNYEHANTLRAKRVNVVTLPPQAPTDIRTVPVIPIISQLNVPGDEIALLTTIDTDVNDAFTYEILSQSIPDILKVSGDKLVIKTQPDIGDVGEILNFKLKVTDDYGLTFEKDWGLLITNTDPFINTTSLELPGINSYVNMGPLAHDYDVSDAFSISMWVKPQNTSATRCLFSKTSFDGNVFGYALYHNASGQLYVQARCTSGLRLYTFTTSVLTSGVWNHVVLTYKGNSNLDGFRVYIDDVIGSTPSNGSLPNSWLIGQEFYLGRRSTSFYLNALIDEISVWNTELLAADVSRIYNGGVPTNLGLDPASGNLQSWYRMGDVDVSPTITDTVGPYNGTMVNMDATNFIMDTPS